MARPTDLPFSWATNALHNDPGEVWDGLATKVAPTASKQLVGFHPEEQPAAEHFNSLLNRLSQWAKYLEELSDPGTYRFVIVRPEEMVQNGAAPWTDTGGAWTAVGDTRICYVPISPLIPSSAVITSVETLLQPAVARPTPSTRMETQLVEFDFGGGAVAPAETVIGLARDDGTTNLQLRTFDLTISYTDPTTGFAGYAYSKANGMRLRIKSGSTAGDDVLHFVKINYRSRTLDR